MRASDDSPDDTPLAPSRATQTGPLTFRRLLSNRWTVKIPFLLFFLLAVVQLLRFERWARGMGPEVARPEVVGGLLPIGHFTSLFAWLKGGGWDVLLPAGLVIILMSVTISLLFKRAFCGWICPVGSIWELFALLGRKLLGRNIRVPRWLDIAGRGLRYLVMGMFLYWLAMVPVQAAVEFRTIPYMWVADLKIIHLMAEPAWIATALLAAVLSVLFGAVWCRYLCPLGGLYSLFGVASPCVVRRDADTCIDCHRCSNVCHAFVYPEKTGVVRAPECDGCMECVSVCPVDGCLEATAPGRIRIEPWVWPLLVVCAWLLMWGFAKALDVWDTTVPKEIFRQVIESGLLEQKTRGFFE